MHTDHSQPGAPAKEEGLLQAIGAAAAEAGLPPALVIRTVRSDARKTAHPRRALTNFHRFLLTGFASSWLRDFNEHRLLQQILLELFAQSQFLADILVRNPELFRWLTSTTVLKTTMERDAYVREALNAVSLFQRSEKKLDSLKRFHRRELLRIGARQILKEADVRTTSKELSALADAIVETVLTLAYDQAQEGHPAPVPRGLAVIGLGKLGGCELNFSSDIDLMFVYDGDGPLTPPVGRSATQHEYYSRVAEFVIRRLTEHTGEGHLYRVDMRLRPDGQSGPLAMSRPATMTYYEMRGELWERQMLIKARIIAGDSAVGERWKKDTRPFVFHKTHLSSPLEEIAKIKSRIESNLEPGTNIKLGSGGIRDIEFVVQALQLIHGGSTINLQTGSTLESLRVLSDAQLLKPAEGEGLSKAYEFLRTVEDRLQLLHGLQEHSLPESPEEKRILARQLSYSGIAAFERALHRYQRTIRTVFASVFGVAGAQRTNESGTVERVSPRMFTSVGFLRPEKAAQNLVSMERELPGLMVPAGMEALLGKLRSTGAPDQCLRNLLTLAGSASVRRALAQAVANESTMELILLLCARSTRCVTLLVREPLLFESLVGRSEDVLGPGLGWTFMLESDLGRFKKFNEFKATLRFLDGELTIREYTRELSDLADAVLNRVVGLVSLDLPDLAHAPIAILGLGKLGGREISFGADLDLVLTYREDASGAIARTVNRFGRMVRQELEGVYAVDFRLRPEGKNAPLATEYRYYMEYLQNRASLWEMQSLIKARFVSGETEFGMFAAESLRDFALTSTLPPSWKKEVISMRARMAKERSKGGSQVDLKVGIGGLVDLEYLVQSLQLRYARQVAEASVQNTFDAIEVFHGAGYLKSRTASRVLRQLEWMRKLELLKRINSESSEFILPVDAEELSSLASAMGLKTAAKLSHAAARARKENRALFVETLKSIAR